MYSSYLQSPSITLRGDDEEVSQMPIQTSSQRSIETSLDEYNASSEITKSSKARLSKCHESDAEESQSEDERKGNDSSALSTPRNSPMDEGQTSR